MPPRLRTILEEPLVHFLALGALLFAASRVLGGSAEEDRTIHVSDAVRRELADAFAHEHGRAPSDDEEGALLEAWIRDEVLYREGLARGLDQGDPGVRARVAASMAFVLQERARVPDPTDAELAAYFDAHRDRWAEDELLDFTHVFVEGSDPAAEARATELLRVVRGGASPAGLGDTFSGGRRYRRRRVADLAATFGEAFAEGLASQAIASWELRRSRFGIHLVRVDARSAASAASLDEVRDEVAAAWRDERRAAAVDREVARLRERWAIER